MHGRDAMDLDEGGRFAKRHARVRHIEPAHILRKTPWSPDIPLYKAENLKFRFIFCERCLSKEWLSPEESRNIYSIEIQ